MEKFIEYTLGVLLLPVMLLNIFGGIVSIIWLLILGQWSLVIGGILIGIIMPLTYSLLALPSMGLMAISATMLEKRNKIGVITALIGSVYEKILLFAWLALVFDFFVVEASSKGIYIIPILLWGYTVTIGPLVYIAQGEGPNAGIGTTFGVLATIVGYLIMSVAFLFKLSPFVHYGIPLIIYMIISIFPPIIIFFSLFKKNQMKTNKDSFAYDLDL